MTGTTDVERFEPWEVPAAYRHDIWVRATDYDALAAKLAEWQAAQHYTYIGKDGKPVLARDLEARAEAAEAERDKFHQLWKDACVRSGKNSLRADAAEQRVATLEAALPATPLDDPRVEALVDLIKRAEHNIPEYYTLWHSDARAALSALEGRT